MEAEKPSESKPETAVDQEESNEPEEELTESGKLIESEKDDQ